MIKSDKHFLLISILVFITVITLPYLCAVTLSNEELIFGGFLLNPLDGNSYLAKMRQGYEGEWKFTLPYSSNPGEGAYLFSLLSFIFPEY